MRFYDLCPLQFIIYIHVFLVIWLWEKKKKPLILCFSELLKPVSSLFLDMATEY